MPDYEILITLTDTSPDYAQHVAWSVGRALDHYPHLVIALQPPLLVPHGAEPHEYLSTSCLHGDMVLPDGRTGHEYCQGETGALGAKIPAQCKFCAAACACSCHGEAGGG